ncbi:hypothetical protein CH063_15025 [Colletotrichum higginsianum]|uniref:Uncharacterized protein n=1 Tax=Colletotrichum higginsianum (strain IMI 349063) TaxID=759273 RepID=H1W135_COLHI|nr:hypothetical protein CH063_15025 [Colletotrichum higginsianum]
MGTLQNPEPTFTLQTSASECSLRRPEPAFTMQGSASESHIHPLFRRTGSYDNLFANSQPSIKEKDDLPSPQEEDEAPGERQMTPPIPEWILSAGTRTSLTGYQSRKLRIDGDGGQGQS